MIFHVKIQMRCCRIMEDLIDREKRDMIIKMKKMGKFSSEDIAEITGFTVEEVEILNEENIMTVR